MLGVPDVKKLLKSIDDFKEMTARATEWGEQSVELQSQILEELRGIRSELEKQNTQKK